MTRFGSPGKVYARRGAGLRHLARVVALPLAALLLFVFPVPSQSRLRRRLPPGPGGAISAPSGKRATGPAFTMTRPTRTSSPGAKLPRPSSSSSGRPSRMPPASPRRPWETTGVSTSPPPRSTSACTPPFGCLHRWRRRSWTHFFRPSVEPSPPRCSSPGCCSPGCTPWTRKREKVLWERADIALPGPRDARTIRLSHEVIPLDIPTTAALSSPYADGKRVIWCSTTGFLGQVLKIDPETFTIIERYIPAFREGAPLNLSPSISGAYNVLDRDGNFFVPSRGGCGIDAFSDSVPGDRGFP